MNPHVRENMIDCFRSRGGHEGAIQTPSKQGPDLSCSLLHAPLPNRAQCIVGAQQIFYKVLIKHCEEDIISLLLGCSGGYMS